MPSFLAGTFVQNRGNLLTQFGTPVDRGIPHYLPLDSEICVDKDIAKGYDLRPRDLRMIASEILRDSASRLTDCHQLLNHRASHDLRLFKSVEVRIRDELGDKVGSLYDVREIKNLM